MRSFSYSNRFTRLPFVRGFLEWLDFFRLVSDCFQQGSAQDTVDEGSLGVAVLFAVFVALLLFVLIPQFLAAFFFDDSHGIMFSGFKLFAQGALLFIYLFIVRLHPEVHRSFRHQSAIHRAVNVFEARQDLQLETLRRASTRSTRDRMSVLLALICWMLLLSIPLQSALSGVASFAWILRALLVLPVVLLLDESIRLASRLPGLLSRVLLAPYFLLQSLISVDPEDPELELAIAALRQGIRLEKAVPSPRRQSSADPEDIEEGFEEFEIQRLVELGSVRADPREFSE